MEVKRRIERRSAAYQTAALPLSYKTMEHRFGFEPNYQVYETCASPSMLAVLERVAGNDPASSVWKTEALPLDDTRTVQLIRLSKNLVGVLIIEISPYGPRP